MKKFTNLESKPGVHIGDASSDEGLYGTTAAQIEEPQGATAGHKHDGQTKCEERGCDLDSIIMSEAIDMLEETPNNIV